MKRSGGRGEVECAGQSHAVWASRGGSGPLGGGGGQVEEEDSPEAASEAGHS